MATGTTSIDKILTQIKQLDYADRINLLEKTIALIKKENMYKSGVKLSSLAGLGAEIWKDVDIDGYIENERQWD